MQAMAAGDGAERACLHNCGQRRIRADSLPWLWRPVVFHHFLEDGLLDRADVYCAELPVEASEAQGACGVGDTLRLLLEEKLSPQVTDEVSLQRQPPHPVLRTTFPSRGRLMHIHSVSCNNLDADGIVGGYRYPIHCHGGLFPSSGIAEKNGGLG